MLKTQTDYLPPELKQHLPAEFLANERSYLRLRETLLPQYRGRWVAVHDGQVIAADEDLVALTDAVADAGCPAYIARVGEEEEVVFRVRRAEFSYDLTYQPFPLPRAEVAFSNQAQTHRQVHPDVIPDIGADVSVLPDTDAVAIDLTSSPSFTALSGGVVGPQITTLIYRGHAEIDKVLYPAFIQAVPGGSERLIGRDVLNQLRVTFDGPACKVIFH